MSKEVDRHAVFQTTKVRTALKNDGCWIQKPKQEQDEAGTNHAEETRPTSVRRYSYVLSTAKKFEPQAPVEQHIQNGEAQSNGEHNGGAVEVSAEVAERIQNDEAQAVSPLEPVEQPVANTTAEINGDPADTTGEQSHIEHNEAKISADAHAETAAAPAVEPKPQEQPSTETEPADATHLGDAGVESTVRPEEGSGEKCPPEQAAEDAVEAVTEVPAKPSSDTCDAVSATPGRWAALQESAETVAEVAVESSPETPAVTAAAGEEAAVQVSVEAVPDLLADTASASLNQADAETAVKPRECKVESAASAEPVSKSGAEEAAECEVQSVHNTVVEQSVESAPERAAAPVEDAVEATKASNAEAVQDKISDRLIELSEALDVEPPTTEAAPKDPKQSEETELNHHSNDTNISDTEKSKEELKSTEIQKEIRNSNVCSFCEEIIEGNVKLHLSEPVVTCHPDCLKCGGCAKALGDLLTPMFLHDRVVKCGCCFAKVLETGA